MRIKKCVSLFIITFLMLPLAGCKKYIIGNVELNEITFPSAVSLDISEENKDNVLVSIEAKKAMKPEGGTGSNENYQSLKSEGRDVFEAGRLLTTYSLKDINWGQNDCIILGDEFARGDVLQYLDYFIRNHENRGTISILVAKGARGEDIIESLQQPGDYVSDKIASLFDDSGAMSIFREINLYEFVSAVQNSYGGAVLPVIGVSGLQAGNFNRSVMTKGIQPLEEANEEDEQAAKEATQGEEKSEGGGESGGGQEGSSAKGDSPGKMLVMTGYGVFKEGKLIGYLDAQLSRALNWVNDQMVSTEIIAYDKMGEKIALEVITSDTKVNAKIKDDKPSVKISIRVSANVVSYHGKEDIFNTDNLKAAEESLSDIITQEVNAVISYAKDNNVDIFDFNGEFHRQNPVKWQKIKGDWASIFPAIPVEVDIKTRISTTYNVKDPLRDEERKEK